MSAPTYSRELIARMLTDLASMGSSIFLGESISEQAELLIAADNADAAGVRTVNATNPLLSIARRNIRQFLAEASFSSEVDKWSAGQCLDVMEAALDRQQPEAPANFRAAEHDGGGFSSDTAALAFLALIGNGNPNVSHAVERLRTSLIAQQPEAPAQEAVAGDQVADIVGRWMDKQLTADAAMVSIKSHLDNCYMQPANDYNRGWVAGANSVTERAAELVAAARAAPQPAIPEGMVLVQRRDAQCLIDNAPDCPHVLLAARRVRDLLRPTQEADHG